MSNRSVVVSRVSTIGIVACVLVGAACGKKDNAGAGPTGPSATSVSSIAISSSGPNVFLGSSEVFTATATLANGTTQAVTGGVWGNDAPAVVSVDASTATVRGLTSGAVTVFVDFQGVRGTKLIKVIPNYQGAWLGSYVIRDCADSGDFQSTGFCASFTPNSVLPSAFQFQQSTSTLSGRTFLGSIPSDPFTATIGGDGRVTVSSTATSDPITIAQTWSLNIVQAGRIVGTLRQSWSASSGLTGQGVINADLINTNVQSVGIAGLTNASRPRVASLSDLIRAAQH